MAANLRILGLVATLATLATLAGCDGVSTISSSYYNSTYSPSHVVLAAANNPSQATIRGNPFPNDRDNSAVIAAMQGRNYGPKMYFSPTPRADDKYGYRVILSFGEKISRNYQCGATGPTGTPAPAGTVALVGTFCVGDIVLTDAVGTVSGVTGPDDPKFRRLIGDVMVALTPPYIPDRGSDHPCPMC